jgi:GAF domain-containing protein
MPASNRSGRTRQGTIDRPPETIITMAAGPAVPIEVADDAELRASLSQLSQLRLGEGLPGLQGLLHSVAVYGVRAIPGADGVGVTLLEPGRSDTIVASHDFVAEIDAIQYGLGQGPCITAARDRRTVHSNALEADADWPQFGPRIAALGVHSVLSLPLMIDDTAVGAMNVYAHAPSAFTERAISFGEVFCVPAAVAVRNAQALFQAHRLTEEMRVAMESRSVIDHALGVMMSRTGGTEQEAFERLRIRSQREHLKIAVLARQLVDEAIRKAQSRRPGG